MYLLKCNEKFNSKLPIPNLSTRYSNICQENKINVVIIKEQFDDPTFRYRGYNIIQTMRNNEKYNVECFLVNELDVLYTILDKIGLIIFQRAIWSFDLENFIKIVKKMNIPIIYDVDDLIYETKYVPRYINSSGDYSEKFMNRFFAIVKRYELIAKSCNGFIVTTNNLKSNILKDLNKPVWVFHNYLNLEQEKISKKIVEMKKEKYLNDKFIIGYFSGSDSHKRDLEISEPALIKLINKYDDIYLKIVGPMVLSHELKKLKEKGKVIINDLVPYEELQYEIGKVDLNIIPLQKHEFNACKSELKYFEASIVNTLTLATDNVVYKNIITDGVDGFLADEISWFEKMEYIYLNYHQLNNVIVNARKKCLMEYGNNNQEKGLEELYDNIIDTLNSRGD